VDRRNFAVVAVFQMAHDAAHVDGDPTLRLISKKVKPPVPLPPLVLAGLVLAGSGFTLPAAGFDLRVTPSPEPVVVNRELTFTLDVTNRMGFTVTNIVVTNVYPASAQLSAVSNFFGGAFTNAGLLLLVVDVLTNDQPARVEFSVLPTALGQLTNAVSLSAFPLTNAALAGTNVVVRVVSAVADLAAGIAGPAPGALVNDWITYRVGATNFGPDAVPNVMLTNPLPSDFKFISVNPSNAAVTFTNGALLFNLGTLASNASAGFQVRVQPTNAGTATLRAQVTAAAVFDTNAANDLATNTFSLGSFLAGQLAAAIASTQQYNPQTGLMEQRITLSNTGATAAVSARVLVRGLTNRLFNAVGTNDGRPYVVYATNLAAGASVDLLLEYFVTNRTAVPDPTLVAVEVPAFSPPIPAGTPVQISRLIFLPSGRVLLEFPAETNRTYSVLYCGDAAFGNQTLVAQPPVVAPADRVQWIDYGPPKTVSHPAHTPSRFYKVIQQP
jgi:uncharacterized repeat protein (TIGR01451 family)